MKTKDYMVQAKLDLFVGITIKAKSLEDAVAQAKDLKEEDFVTIDGDFIDGNVEINGVLEN